MAESEFCKGKITIYHRALVSTGATGAIAPELFEGHNVKNIF